MTILHQLIPFNLDEWMNSAGGPWTEMKRIAMKSDLNDNVEHKNSTFMITERKVLEIQQQRKALSGVTEENPSFPSLQSVPEHDVDKAIGTTHRWIDENHWDDLPAFGQISQKTPGTRTTFFETNPEDSKYTLSLGSTAIDIRRAQDKNIRRESKMREDEAGRIKLSVMKEYIERVRLSVEEKYEAERAKLSAEKEYNIERARLRMVRGGRKFEFERSRRGAEEEYEADFEEAYALGQKPLASRLDGVVQDVMGRAKTQWTTTSPSHVFEIPSVLDQTYFTDALGDYCAKSNFMREEYAIHLGLTVNRQNTSEVIVGSGKKVTTTGTAETIFRFQDENKSYPLTFHLLPNCLHNVILGKSFLKFTQTFSSLGNRLRRVKERILKGVSHHFLYLGESAPRFEGLINGVREDALADSGAKVLVMDEAYARSRGFPIRTGPEHRTKLRFADDSVAYTSGMTYGVQWEFGPGGKSEQYSLDFHILKNAPANVILSDAFLFGTDAYSEYDCYLIDDDNDEDGFFFAIDIDTAHLSHDDSKQTSLSDMKYYELVRRGEEEDRISRLSAEEQIIAWETENKKRAEWERLRLDLELSQSIPTIPTPALNGSIPSPNPSTPNSGGGQHIGTGTTPTKRSKWRFRLKRKALP